MQQLHRRGYEPCSTSSSVHSSSYAGLLPSRRRVQLPTRDCVRKHILVLNSTSNGCLITTASNDKPSIVKPQQPETPSHTSNSNNNEEVVVELDELRKLLHLQQSIIDKQQNSIDQLKKLVEQQHQTNQAQKQNAGQQASTGWNSSISPFEAQRIGIGDRRLLGLYDARFHSTAA